MEKLFREVVNENLTAGSYEVNWDAKNYTSGIYFYRIETDEFTNVKKMLLLNKINLNLYKLLFIILIQNLLKEKKMKKYIKRLLILLMLLSLFTLSKIANSQTTWFPINPGISNQLHWVEFVNPNTGYCRWQWDHISRQQMLVLTG